MINGVNIGCHIELKLGLLMTKGQLEVDVVCARGIRAEDSPPGKYDNNVTRFIRNSHGPFYSIIDLLFSAKHFKMVFPFHSRILSPFLIQAFIINTLRNTYFTFFILYKLVL